MGYQPIRRWWCFSTDLEDWAVGSETYCRFGRHGEHSVACGWKVLVDADSWRLRSDFTVTSRGICSADFHAPAVFPVESAAPDSIKMAVEAITKGLAARGLPPY